MRKVIPMLIALFCCSCREYKALMSEKSEFSTGKAIQFLDENKELLNVAINGKDHVLFFDTGAGATILNDVKFNLKDTRVIRQKKIYGFDKKTMSTSTTYSVDSLETGLFTTKNKYLYISDLIDKNPCYERKFDGILGNFFSEIENEIELNYEKGYIKILENTFNKSEYVQLDAKFNSISGKFYIQIEANNTNDYFLFDTGNKTGIIINKEVFKQLPSKVTSFSVFNNTVNNTLVRSNYDIYQVNFKLSENLSFDQYVALDSTSKRSVLNQQFIKKFNWIIDKKNSKVYCKPIDLKKLNSVYKAPSKSQQVSVIESKILISFRMNSSSKYQIGDEIISVNNEKVTLENLCEMQKRLNETNDWGTLEIEVKSHTKPQS